MTTLLQNNKFMTKFNIYDKKLLLHSTILRIDFSKLYIWRRTTQLG